MNELTTAQEITSAVLQYGVQTLEVVCNAVPHLIMDFRAILQGLVVAVLIEVHINNKVR